MRDPPKSLATLKNEHSLTYVQVKNIGLIGAFSKRIVLKTAQKKLIFSERSVLTIGQ
jgi:hypothetical protein